ncbi:MAG: membrane protein insertase YidC [Acidobacteriota bacterium]|nr:membrane protein insertase YidC [Acidobacteriota bacterium]
MADNKQSTQFRFLLAATLSMAVLFGWTYLFPAKKIEQTNSNTAQVVANDATTPAPQIQPAQPAVAVSASDNTPNRQITINTPLYQVKLDSKGALATSWILLKNQSKQGEYPVFADGSTTDNQKPLELISQEALNRNPREIPFRLVTGDGNLNAVLNDRNYQISATEDVITLEAGQERKIDFTLTDESGIEVTKSFLFRADNYVADLAVKLTRGGETVPNTKLLIGASIGDHAINHHNFYHIESEAVAAVNGDIVRHQGNYAFTFDANNQSSLAVPGVVDWAGVGDAYFAMAAIPAAQTRDGLEYHASKYEVQTQPYFDGIFSWITRSERTSETRHLVTAHVPITADGSVTRIYTGTKDYFALNDYNDILTNSVGRPISIENLINFSNYAPVRWFVKPLSVPILSALTFINNFTHNYGVAIIIFTFFFYSLLFPLRWSQSRSFKKAAGNAPKMKELQDKLKDFQKKGIPADDPRMRELQMEQLKMMKTAVPLGGCLPMLLQFPLLISFYTAVTISLSIRQANFLWLPDLSAGDPWHLLEFAFALSMVLAMKFTPTAAAVTPEQQMQQKMMMYLMPVMMLWVMWSAPAGLLLYWFFGNIVSFGQQMVINRMNKSDEPPKEEVVDSIPEKVKKVKPKLSTS